MNGYSGFLREPNKLSLAYHDIAYTSFPIRKGKAHCGPLYGLSGQKDVLVLFLLRQAAAHHHDHHPEDPTVVHAQSAFLWAPAFVHL